MKKKNKAILAAAALAVGLALTLTGCSNNGSTPGGASINSFEVTLPDGRIVQCVAVGGNSVDCDWANTK